MAQFDVHRNPGGNQSGIPFIVVVQSSRFDRLATRVVIPLRILRQYGESDPDVAPRFLIAGQEVFLNPLEIVTIPRTRIGEFVTSLANDEASTRIINAIDAVISRVYG